MISEPNRRANIFISSAPIIRQQLNFLGLVPSSGESGLLVLRPFVAQGQDPNNERRKIPPVSVSRLEYG